MNHHPLDMPQTHTPPEPTGTASVDIVRGIAHDLAHLQPTTVEPDHEWEVEA